MERVDIAPGHWLRADAAASYQRMRAARMPAGGINDAGRTYAEQQVMYARYLSGLLPATAARPGTSKHETGTALDLAGAALAWVREHGRAFGWLIDRVRNEPWHVEYVLVLDQRLTDTTTPAPLTPNGDTMSMSPEVDAAFHDLRLRDENQAKRIQLATDNAYAAAQIATRVLNAITDPTNGLAVRLARQSAELAALRASGAGASGVDIEAVADAASRETVSDLFAALAAATVTPTTNEE